MKSAGVTVALSGLGGDELFGGYPSFRRALKLASGKWRTKVVANNPGGFEELRAWLVKHGVICAHVCMEATGVYWEAVAAHLADNGFAVSVLNPAQIKAFGASSGVRTKTDEVDAKLIAQFCEERNPGT